MTENGLDRIESLSDTRVDKKLVLHFDIRNTLIVADTVTSITVEQALNAYLTGVLWGKEGENETWEWHSSAPSLKAPTPGTTTYYKHLEKTIVREPVDRTKLRLTVGDFVHTKMGSSFQDYHTQHLTKLEWGHATPDPKLTLPGSDGKHYHYILPAVYKLIQHLRDQKRDFNLVIRTYGLDCENVLKSLNHCIEGKQHPSFPDLPDMSLRLHSGHIVRQDGDKIKLQMMERGKRVDEISDPDSVYKYLCEYNGVCGFRDDFEYWQNNNYSHKCAKPLWIDPNDSRHQHIIFDDNYRPHHEDSIVDIKLKEARGKWRSLGSEELHKYDNMSLVQVDLLEAINNDQYYVERVRECEAKFDKQFTAA